MLTATVDLPDGPAVVHSEFLAVHCPISGQERQEQEDTVRHNFAVVAPSAGCPTVLAVDPVLVTKFQADGWTWTYANVLCTQPACRAAIEEREANQESEHPAAPHLWVWAYENAGGDVTAAWDSEDEPAHAVRP